MKKHILCLSGWGQKFDSLESIFDPFSFGNCIESPNCDLHLEQISCASDAQVYQDTFRFGSQKSALSASSQRDSMQFPRNHHKFEVKSFDYSKFDKTEKFFEEIKKQNFTPDVVIGWSLGGQLAIRLIEKEILKPKLLILLAPPFQMVKDSRIAAGMAKNTFAEFYKNFADAPTKTLKQFSILTAMNDKNAADIARNLDVNDENFAQLKFWLEELARFSCFDVDFTNMPRTLYFHGAGDMIVHVKQADYFKERIKNLRFEIFKNCGHAPHLSDMNKLREIILEEIESLN